MQDIESKIKELKSQLTGDMFKDMDIKSEIHNLELKLKGSEKDISYFECFECGS